MALLTAPPKPDLGRLAVELLELAIETGSPEPVLGSAEALLGIARPGKWAGEVEARLLKLAHKHQQAIRRASKAVSRSVVPERPPREVPVLPLLVVHGSVWRVLVDPERGYLSVQRELAAVELARLHAVETTIPVGETGSRGMKPQEVYDAHGVTADRIRWTYGSRASAWEEASRTLDLPGARVREGRAARSARVEGWLARLVVERQLPKLLDWLASAARLDRPTSAVQIRGPDSIGKAMLAAALSTWLGGTTSYGEATGDFSAPLIHGPLVLLDEGVADAVPDAFRRITGNTVHRVVAKHQMGQDLVGCPRVLITSNEPDPLRLGREELSSESEHALGRRILVLDGQVAAARYLEEIGGWDTTASWAAPDGELVCHLRWLAQERDVVPGRRFLVEGDGEGWVATAHLRRGVGADVLAAYRAYLDDPALRERCVRAGEPFLHEPDTVGISVGVLQRCWKVLLGGHDKVPSNQHLAKALRRLSGQDKPERGGPEAERGPRRYWVPLARLEEGEVT